MLNYKTSSGAEQEAVQAPKSFLGGVRDQFFYRQERVGKGGVLFDVWKFKTMRDGDSKTDEASVRARMTGRSPDAERVTPLGAILRHFGPDEIPQIMNWLRGDLQWLGFRPKPLNEVQQLTPDLRDCYLSRKPGLVSIDLAVGYSKSDFEQRMELMRAADRLAEDLDSMPDGPRKIALQSWLTVRSVYHKWTDPVHIRMVREKLSAVVSNF